MIWSVSSAKMFDRCQRQWFYKTHFASHKAKDETRRKAYLLSKLQSVSAWRGSLVDHVLSFEVLPALQRGSTPSVHNVVASAMARFDRQLAVARRHRIHEPGFRPSTCEDFVALYAIEYEGGIADEELEQAREEVKVALHTFFSMGTLIERLRAAQRLITQRRLIFNHSDTKVGAVLDVIVFSAGNPPAVLDWKVHAFGRHDAWLQLAIYAAAVKRTESRSGFPTIPDAYDETQVGLLEVQLLTGTLRRHRLTDEDVERADSYIARSAEAMMLAAGEADGDTLTPAAFPAASYASTCTSCPYRSLCWETLQ
jgi:PD-(D/E)XK nuclease superfamily